MVLERFRWTLWLPIALAGGCTSGASSKAGACVVVTAPSAPCASGFVGYSCTGSARPDEDGQYISGVPIGIVCTNVSPVDGGAAGGVDYCCTEATTPCVYDPVAGCNAPTYGYQCRGSDRPEAFDPTLHCGEGQPENDLITYCCAGTLPTPGCQQSTNAACATTLVAWQCSDQTLPSEAELGSNQSRADFSLLVCSVPTVTTSLSGASTSKYCCFTPTAPAVGATCLQDTTLPGCAPGSFGFACTGPDTPEEDYSRIHCPGPGARGPNTQGYPATQYCCQYN